MGDGGGDCDKDGGGGGEDAGGSGEYLSGDGGGGLTGGAVNVGVHGVPSGNEKMLLVYKKE